MTVSGLDFLSIDRAETAGEFRPLARSSMEQPQRDAGATFAERDGWLVATSFPDEAAHHARVGVADLSHLGKLDVRGASHPPLGTDIVWYQVHSERALCISPPGRTPALREELSRGGGRVVDQSAALAILALVGPEADAVRRRLTDLHKLPASGQVAGIRADVLARGNDVWIVFGQDHGRYLWEVVVDAAEPFGGGPIGLGSHQQGDGAR